MIFLQYASGILQTIIYISIIFFLSQIFHLYPNYWKTSCCLASFPLADWTWWKGLLLAFIHLITQKLLFWESSIIFCWFWFNWFWFNISPCSSWFKFWFWYSFSFHPHIKTIFTWYFKNPFSMVHILPVQKLLICSIENI